MVAHCWSCLRTWHNDSSLHFNFVKKLGWVRLHDAAANVLIHGCGIAVMLTTDQSLSMDQTYNIIDLLTHSLNSEDNFCSGGWNVSHQQQFTLTRVITLYQLIYLMLDYWKQNFQAGTSKGGTCSVTWLWVDYKANIVQCFVCIDRNLLGSCVSLTMCVPQCMLLVRVLMLLFLRCGVCSI